MIMRNLIKKLNDQRSFVFNALIFAGVYTILFILILLPFVVVAMTQNTNTLNDAENATYVARSELYQVLDFFVPFLVFGILGGITEFCRRSFSAIIKHRKKDDVREESFGGYIYISSLIVIHLIIEILLLFV